MNRILLLSLAICAGLTQAAASSQESQKPRDIKPQRHPILQAAQAGDLTQIQSLVAAGTPITTASTSGSSAIHFAAENGHDVLVGALLANFDIPPDARGAHKQTAAHWAAKNGHISVLAMLKKYGANMNAQEELGRSPLFHAAFNNKTETIDYLLDEAGADPFIKNHKTGATVLHLSALNNLTESLAHLLKRNIFPPDIRADDGATPLHYASNSTACTVLLLEYGCNKDARDSEGCTPLLAAVSRNNALVIEVLLSHGASTNIADNDGITPLILAAERGHFCLVATLIASGANICAASQDGTTPLLAATRNGDYDIITLLLAAQEMQAAAARETTGPAQPSSSNA